MIVKGTKQLSSFKRGINLYVPRKVLSNNNLESIQVNGAGISSLNGVYLLAGTTTIDGRTFNYYSKDGLNSYPRIEVSKAGVPARYRWGIGTTAYGSVAYPYGYPVFGSSPTDVNSLTLDFKNQTWSCGFGAWGDSCPAPSVT